MRKRQITLRRVIQNEHNPAISEYRYRIRQYSQTLRKLTAR
ncbi:Uncharacterized protein dnm_095460 [Desulfonema magnum]|uniref:Uncharacterized protein n=1 Tax=Desulfonema magnum TaxID=45655 RepID=A0A975BYF4_9BACT|nr:Uncharacterized protein dnm_095460 [Desulfonema magnum]